MFLSLMPGMLANNVMIVMDEGGKKKCVGKIHHKWKVFLFAGKMIEPWALLGDIPPKKLLDLESWPLQWWNLGQQPSTPSAPKKRFQKIKKSTKHCPTLPRSFQNLVTSITPITPITPSSHLPRSTALPPPAPHGARPRSDAPRDFRDFD